MSFWKIFTGDAFSSIEKIATEFIETDKESAEAKAVMVKALDPNGKMRRDISRRVRDLYTLYIAVMVILVIMQSFGLGDPTGVEKAISSLTDLFVPITTMFSAIVGASFGVNGLNASKQIPK